MEVGKEIVLAAGAINSPQILLLSGRGRRGTTCVACRSRWSPTCPGSGAG